MSCVSGIGRRRARAFSSPSPRIRTHATSTLTDLVPKKETAGFYGQNRPFCPMLLQHLRNARSAWIPVTKGLVK